MIHPSGNITEHLVAAGLARVVDWHAGMLASSGGMERLRAAEKLAKGRRLYLYANLPSAASGGKSNGPASNGQSQIFDATVVRVWSGDQISVVEKDSAMERRLQLSSTRGPKYVSTTFKLSVLFLQSNNLGSLIPDKPSTHRKLENF